MYDIQACHVAALAVQSSLDLLAAVADLSEDNDAAAHGLSLTAAPYECKMHHTKLHILDNFFI